MSRECTEEVFLKDVAGHQMKVLLDSGVHRCLRFQHHGSSINWFEVITWPGSLAYTGDMGSFVFTRLDDMFRFFRGPKEGPLKINLSYWGEKLEAVECHRHHPGHKEYSKDKLRGMIEDHVASWIKEFDGPYDADEAEIEGARTKFTVALKKAVQCDIFTYLDAGALRAREAVRDFTFKYEGDRFRSYNSLQFHDSWEWD